MVLRMFLLTGAGQNAPNASLTNKLGSDQASEDSPVATTHDASMGNRHESEMGAVHHPDLLISGDNGDHLDEHTEKDMHENMTGLKSKSWYIEPVVINSTTPSCSITYRGDDSRRKSSYRLEALPTKPEQDNNPQTHRWHAKALRRLKPRLRPPSIMCPQLLDLRARQALCFILLLQVWLVMKVIISMNT